MALLFAVSALAALGMLSLSVFTLARSEREAGQLAMARIQARGGALAALTQAQNGWVAGTPLLPGDSALVAGFSVPGVQAAAHLHSLGGPVQALRAVASRLSPAGAILAEARLDLLVLVGPPDSNSIVRPRPYPRGLGWLP